MPILRIPKTIRWLLILALIFLVAMSGYRFVLHIFFKDGVTHGALLAQAFLTGFRFDARIIGGLTLWMLVMGLIPGMHLFKTTAGKNTALGLYTLFTGMMLLFFLADLIYLHLFNERLSGSIVSDLAKNTEKGMMYKQNTPWTFLLLTIAMLTAASFFLFKRIHKAIGKYSGSDYPLVRIYWQVILAMLCIFALHGRLGKTPLNRTNATISESAYSSRLSLNPVQSFLTSLPPTSK